jgi:hypothetical protein
MVKEGGSMNPMNETRNERLIKLHPIPAENNLPLSSESREDEFQKSISVENFQGRYVPPTLK